LLAKAQDAFWEIREPRSNAIHVNFGGTGDASAEKLLGHLA